MPPNLRYQIGIMAKLHRIHCADALDRATTEQERRVCRQRLREAEEALKSKYLLLKKKRRRGTSREEAR